MPLESTWTSPRDDCPQPELWHAPDAEATETEVSHFLGALCGALKPKKVLETGAYKGYTAQAIGWALKGFGHLDTLEKDESLVFAARVRCRDVPVTVHHLRSLEFEPTEEYDMMFFDSDPNDRIAEMKYFSKWASNRCVWALHDSRGMKLQQGANRYPNIFLPTPRGLTIGRFE